MIREVKIKWNELYYPSGVLKYEGFTKIDSRVNEIIPYGQGIKYFEDGKKNMEVLRDLTVKNYCYYFHH